MNNHPPASLLKKIRGLLIVFIVFLVLSGLTAFPLLKELNLLSRTVNAMDWLPEALRQWIFLVQQGLENTYAQYPFIAYGTDWLAFGHLMIAVFFLGPFKNPVKNVWVIQAGLIACILVIPTALICGTIRGIPFFWMLVDCSFGVFGFLLLAYILKLVQRLELEK